MNRTIQIPDSSSEIQEKAMTMPAPQEPDRPSQKKTTPLLTAGDPKECAIVLRKLAPRVLALVLLLAFVTSARAEDRIPGETARAQVAPVTIQYWRPHDSRGINQFEPPKLEGVPYNGFAMNWGGGFTQQFQALHHSNNATPVISGTPPVNQNQLKRIGAGFNNATANMYMDAQLPKGIRVQ